VRYGEVPLVDAVATHDAADGRAAVFLVNRAQQESATVTVDLAFCGAELLEALTLADPELDAGNTLDQPERVRLAANPLVRVDGTRLTAELPAVSWTAVSLAV
jgi:alpha-N-arabinofuranosidase